MSNLVSSFEKKMKVGIEENKKNIVDLTIDRVLPDPEQVRFIFDENKLTELSESIKEHGVINPIHVRKAKEKYIIITGERRYRASKLAKLNTIPCIIYDDVSEEEIRALMLIENLQREDLSCIETSKGMLALKETGLKQNQIARSLGISKSNVTKYLSIVDPKKMPKSWLKEIEEKHNKATLTDLYKIASANRKSKNKLYKKMMEEANLQIDITLEEDEKQKPKREKSEFSEEQLKIVWEKLIKEKRKNIQNICKYVSTKKIESILENEN